MKSSASSPPASHRNRFLQALAVAGVACAMWFALVRPAEHASAKQRAELARMQAVLNESGTDTTGIDAAKAQAAEAKASFESLKLWVDRSSDSSKLFEAISRLAGAHSVRLERLDPAGTKPITKVTAAGMGKRPKTGDSTGEVLTYRMTVSGTFAKVVDFINACETDLGASKVQSFRISQAIVSDNAADAVEAQIETAHLKIDWATKPAPSEAMPADPTPSPGAEPMPLAGETP